MCHPQTESHRGNRLAAGRHDVPGVSDQDAHGGPTDGKVPLHIAIIMDGNGRWARQHGLDIEVGHRAGFTNIEPVLERLADEGVREVTLFAFSTENWQRPREEVESLMSLMSNEIAAGAERFNQKRVRLRHIGDDSKLPQDVRDKVREAVALTAPNTELTLNVAFDYGGRSEIVHAIRRIIAEGVAPDMIDESTVERHLYTAGGSDPDLVIRTGGEFRISNFLLWQSAYAEFHSTPTLWPDFGERDIAEALRAYASRERRFGARPSGTSERHGG